MRVPSAEMQTTPGPRADEKGATKAAGASSLVLRSVVWSAVRRLPAGYRRRCPLLAWQVHSSHPRMHPLSRSGLR